MTKNKIQIANKAIMVLGLVFPCVLATIHSFIITFVGWDRLGWTGHTNDYFLISQLNHPIAGLLFVIASLVLIVLLYSGIKRINRKRLLVIDCALVYLISLIIRIAVLSAINWKYGNMAPFSDFAQVWEIANGDLASIKYKSLFAAWMNYANLEHIFVSVFGNNYSFLLMFNCFISSITVPLVYLICRTSNICSNDCAVIASLLYSFYCPSVLFSLIGAPDVIVVPFNLLAILILIGAEKSRKKGHWNAIVFALAAGVIIGASASIKSFGEVVIIAYIIVVVVSLILEKNETKFRPILNRIGVLIVCVCCILSSYFITKETILRHTEKVFAVELDYSTATPHYLLVGLNTEGEGQIHIGNQSRLYYQSLLDEELSPEDARQTAYKTILYDWQECENPLVELILPKTVWAWQDDTMPFRYIDQALKSSSDSTSGVIDQSLFDIISSCLQLSYVTIMITSVIGMIIAIKNDSNSYGGAFIILIIVGYFFVTLISEAQSRYKYIIMPLVCIIGSIGLSSLMGIVIKRINMLKKSGSNKL